MSNDDCTKATSRLDRWGWASILGLAVLGVLGAFFGTDVGITWDEDVHRVYGDGVIAWFSSGFKDNQALTYLNLYLYGGLWDASANLIAKLSPLPLYDTRHLLSILTSLAGLVATGKMAALIGGRRAGFLAGALLVLTPVWTGHSLFNNKDIPFAVFAAWSTWAAMRVALSPAPVSWRLALGAGLATGAALGVRIGGVMMFGYLALAAAGQLSLAAARSGSAWKTSLRRLVPATAARLAAALAVAWAVMVAAWPWAQLNPILNPLRASAEAARFDWPWTVLFDGREEPAKDLPLRYLPQWFAVTLPEIWLLALLIALAALGLAWRTRREWKGERPLAMALLVLAALGPIAAALVMHPVLYDAHRHFLFVIPPAAALMGIGVSAFLGSGLPRLAKGLATAGLVALAALTSYDMARLHPYEYIHFNRLFGGLRAAQGRYETDYWAAATREALAWVVKNVHPSTGRPLEIGTCGAQTQILFDLPRFPEAKGRFVAAADRRAGDIILAHARWNCDATTPGTVLHTVERDGVPLMKVILSPPRR